MLTQIIYISRMTQKLDTSELAAILDTAVKFNQRHDITGLLLVFKDDFIQVLEGRALVIDDLVDRIRLDSRHTEFRIVSRVEIEDREFGRWAMGFQDASGLSDEHAQHISAFLADGFNDQNLAINPDIGLEIVRELAKSIEAPAA